ncbi:hypothetical protein ACRAWC_16450 [Leifsonia sp. L25]|uniref:hypothetical protein n=1 Tax=Leifsonia sp. L25 TaxID=3423957 RepID=UPI003D68BB77
MVAAEVDRAREEGARPGALDKVDRVVDVGLPNRTRRASSPSAGAVGRSAPSNTYW